MAAVRGLEDRARIRRRWADDVCRRGVGPCDGGEVFGHWADATVPARAVRVRVREGWARVRPGCAAVGGAQDLAAVGDRDPDAGVRAHRNVVDRLADGGQPTSLRAVLEELAGTCSVHVRAGPAEAEGVGGLGGVGLVGHLIFLFPPRATGL